MIIIEQPVFKKEGEYNHLSSVFRTKDVGFEVWFKTRNSIHASADVFVVAFLIAAMHHGEDIYVRGTMSRKLFYALNKIQAAYCKWHTDLKRINIKANSFYDDIPKIDPTAETTACFFTGGADSFYTLLKNNAEISKLIYVHGFDVNLHEIDFLALMDGHMEKVSQEFNKELIKVETNLHLFSDRYANWTFYHCSALASVSILLSQDIHKIFTATAYDTEEFMGWSISAVDRFWSTERIDFVPDGFEANRLDKIIRISDNPVCQDHLKVCIDRTSGKYNCSECEKCVRTMISLYITGKWHKFKTFEMHRLIELTRDLKLDNKNAYLFAQQNYNALPAGEIKSALKISIDNFYK